MCAFALVACWELCDASCSKPQPKNSMLYWFSSNSSYFYFLYYFHIIIVVCCLFIYFTFYYYLIGVFAVVPTNILQFFSPLSKKWKFNIVAPSLKLKYFTEYGSLHRQKGFYAWTLDLTKLHFLVVWVVSYLMYAFD